MPIKLLMTSCQSASDIIAMHGVDKKQFMIFREYDYGCYADDNADDDTPVWDETAGDPDPPATPTGLTQRFVYSGPWQGESLWGASVSWTLSNMNKSAYSLIMDYDVFEPTSTAATATTETVDLTAGVILPLVPSQLLFTCLYRFADNATAGETGTFQDSATVTIDYLADNADPPTTVRQTWTVDLDDSDDNDWHLLSIRLAADTSEQYHAIRLNIDGDTKNLHHIAIGYPFLNVAGQLSNASIGVNYTFSEGAGASDTVNQYRITGIQPGGERVTVATAPQGSTEIEATIVSGAGNGTRPGGTSSIFSFQNYILQSASFGGLTATGSKDIYSDNRATFYPNSSPVIDQAALDWDPTNIAASYVPSVGSDGLTKEYKDVGLIPVGAEAISTTTSAVMTNARHRVTASGITVTIPDGTVTEEKHEFKVQSGVTWAKLTGKINSASSTTNTVYDGEAFEFVWTGTYWEQIT